MRYCCVAWLERQLYVVLLLFLTSGNVGTALKAVLVATSGLEDATMIEFGSCITDCYCKCIMLYLDCFNILSIYTCISIAGGKPN